MKTKKQKVTPLRFSSYTAEVMTPSGIRTVNYGTVKPIIGAESEGAQKPNKIVSFKFE